jgi:hypothetical protein
MTDCKRIGRKKLQQYGCTGILLERLKTAINAISRYSRYSDRDANLDPFRTQPPPGKPNSLGLLHTVNVSTLHRFYMNCTPMFLQVSFRVVGGEREQTSRWRCSAFINNNHTPRGYTIPADRSTSPPQLLRET